MAASKKKSKQPSYTPLYEIFTGEDLKVAELILRRRLQMLVHSYLYYELDQSILTDWQWGQWAQELDDLQKQHPDIAEKVWWHEDFADFGGYTGAFLPLRGPWVRAKAKYLLMMHETRGGNQL